MRSLEQEKKPSFKKRYDFEDVLDECGFRYLERLNDLTSKKEEEEEEGKGEKELLWNIQLY
jgi:hypothetical protein